MEKQVRHWLNGRFGWGRRVVKIYLGDDGYRVEAAEGSGDAARRRSWHPPTEEDALHLADELMSDSDDWRDVTHLSRPELLAPTVNGRSFTLNSSAMSVERPLTTAAGTFLTSWRSTAGTSH